MSRAERMLQLTLLGIIGLHAAGFLLSPGKLWGVSQLAAWPTWIGLLWLALAVVVVVLGSRAATRLEQLSFPGPRGLLVILASAALLFFLLHETQHLFGDGALLIRSRGMSVTFLRAPVLVRSIVWIVRGAEDNLGIGIATGIAVLSMTAGVLALVWMHGIARTLTAVPLQRWLVFAALASAGACQLFFGHVEYYGVLAAAVLAWLWIALRELHHDTSPWVSWVAYGVLLTLHLSALGLFPAQVYLGVRAWRLGRRRALLWAPPLAAGVFWLLLQLAHSGAQALATEAGGGILGYLAPYFDAESSRHAFGFFAVAHALAVGNDLLLAAPLAVALLVVVVTVRRTVAHPALPFLAWASLGCLGINVLFNREIGAIRDWDTLAPYAFIYLTWGMTELLARPSLRPQRVLVMMVGVAILHALPWTLLNAIPGAADRQIRILLQEAGQWSPYARGYLHEEFAIAARQAGDLQTALREYEAASQASPADARYHVGRGDTLYRLGRAAEAIDAYEEAIRWRPSWMPAHNNLAAVLLASGGDLERARQHAREATRLNAGNAEAWVTLGDVELARNDIAAAVGAFETALRLRPSSARVAQRLQDARRRSPDADPRR